ncbi:TlpA family protein disulfide reductase [Polaribacter sp. R77954]|uniref:TlpA family protein disulfide reductase n=1 Tax=Polaribacter sp. R77954 TaxID=3093870 RepID=UPI0037C7B14E
MKKKLLSLVLLLATLSLLAQKVIVNPAYEVKRSSIYDVDKIELTETETRVHVRGTIIPGWHMRFRKNDFLKDYKTGKEYIIIKIENHKFNERILIPESGTKTVVLVFPPLDKGVKKIDFKHAVYGISLEKQRNNKPKEVPKYVNQWIEKELNKVTISPIKDFNSKDFFNSKKAKLIGYIKEYDKRLKFNTGIIYQKNNVTREDYPIVVQVYEDGRFEAEIPLIHPETNYIKINKSAINYYLEPGQTLAIILDYEDFRNNVISRMARSTRYTFKKTIFKGPLAKINNHLNNFKVKDFDYRTFNEKFKTLSIDDFRKEQDATLRANLELLNSYVKNNNVNHKTKEVLENILRIDYATLLFDFVRKSDNEAKKNKLYANLRTPITDNYYDFLKDIDFNNKALLVPNRFSIFVNRFEFSKPMSVYPNRKFMRIEPEITLDKYLETHKIKLTENDKKLREVKNQRFTSYEEYQKFQKKFSKPYQEALVAYNTKYIQPLLDKQKVNITENTMEKWRLRDSVVKNTFHLERNLVQDLTKIRALNFDIKRTDSENARKYWNVLKTNISNAFLISQGERIVNKKFPVDEQITQKVVEKTSNENLALKAKTTKLPKGKATAIFNDIIKSHKGKILFVDFWATTCAPCVSSIKKMKEIRKEYKNNVDVDFVFITVENQSPERRYMSFVKDQKLENTYRIPVDNFNYLRQLFKFNGIPKYVVIAKNGEVINDDYKMYEFTRTVDDIIKNYK